MAPYADDRAFSDYIHQHLAIPLIYQPLGWQRIHIEAAQAKEMDMNKAIDYLFINDHGEAITVQERFREGKYQNYSDITIRYKRERNPHPDRKESEFFKLKADYLTYGICDGTKATKESNTSFLKHAIINMRKVYEKINQGFIIIKENGGATCKLDNGNIICPVRNNHDGSSSFVPIDIPLLIQLWGEEVVVSQKGFC